MTELPLRPYQLDCINASLLRGNHLIALVQGAGKSRTAIEIVKALCDEGTTIAGAIFCSNTLKYQWAETEIPKWDPGAKVLVINGTKGERRRQFLAARTGEYRYVILNYEALVHDWEEIKTCLPIDFIVGDEITAIKGFRAKRSQRLKQLAAQCQYRFGLTGTPVENRPEELFSIMEFVDPTLLGNFRNYDKTFIVRQPGTGKPLRYVNLSLLQERLKQAMYRRSRDDIAQFLPERVETDRMVKLNPKQQEAYDYVALDLVNLMQESIASGDWDLDAHYGAADTTESNVMKGQVMARIMALRMICLDPSMVLDSADRFDSPLEKTGSAYASALVALNMFDFKTMGSAKLDDIVEDAKLVLDDPTNKLVIYSSWVPAVETISSMLTAKGYKTVYMSGNTSAEDRREAINAFNGDPSVRCFVSSDAGAYGVNLDQGTHLFCADFPWGAGVLSQRVARIDRTSTTAPTIFISYYATENTIDIYQRDGVRQKQSVADAFVDGKHYDKEGRLDLSMSGLRQFLEEHLPLGLN